MAIENYNYVSNALMHPTTVKVVTPTVRNADKTMYFLHGAVSDGQNCLDNVDFQKLSDKYRMAFVIPDAGNSFYIDHGPAFGNYGKFVGRELVEVTRATFGFSRNREDTAIAGFSMGGYGAIRNGLRYPKNFGYVIAMSAACMYEPSAPDLADTRFGYFKTQFFDNILQDKINPGPFSENYRYLLEQNLEKKIPIPQFYLCCGENEELIQVNREFARYLSEKDVNSIFVTDPGEHNWTLWSRQLIPAIEWFERG